jgi:hypothetical protein
MVYGRIEMQRRSPDKLTEFSYRLAQIKFVIFELVFFGLSLYGLYQVVKHQFGF